MDIYVRLMLGCQLKVDLKDFKFLTEYPGEFNEKDIDDEEDDEEEEEDEDEEEDEEDDEVDDDEDEDEEEEVPTFESSIAEKLTYFRRHIYDRELDAIRFEPFDEYESVYLGYSIRDGINGQGLVDRIQQLTDSEVYATICRMFGQEPEISLMAPATLSC